jgi:hypothetical protein
MVISPSLVFLVYYLNICVLHNLHNTFSMTSNYHTRIKKYLTFAILISIILLIISIAYSKKNNLYANDFLEIYYGIGFIVMIVFSYRVVYLLFSREAYFSLFAGTWNQINKKGLLVKLFNRHLTFCIFFCFCFLLNNLIQLIKEYKPLAADSILSYISVYMISLSTVFTFLNKFSESSMQKYYNKIFFFLSRNKVN